MDNKLFTNNEQTKEGMREKRRNQQAEGRQLILIDAPWIKNVIIFSI